MPMTDMDDRLCRVELMATGSPTWDLSPNDLVALKAVLDDRKEAWKEVAKLKAQLSAAPRLPPATTEDDAYLAAVKQCREIIELCGELPTDGEDFGESVREKVSGMLVWIETNHHVTTAMQSALDNMQHGLERWLR